MEGKERKAGGANDFSHAADAREGTKRGMPNWLHRQQTAA